MVVLRLNPQHAPELVWVLRLDPARAEILSVPTPRWGRRCGNIVLLNSEAPASFRRRSVAVEELSLLTMSNDSTWEVTVTLESGDHLATLATDGVEFGVQVQYEVSPAPRRPVTVTLWPVLGGEDGGWPQGAL